MPNCFSCGREVEVLETVGRGESCPHCDSDMHCCRNCEFYDPISANECREPVAERVLEKDRSNFCDFFRMAVNRRAEEMKVTDAKMKLEQMFKKRP